MHFASESTQKDLYNINEKAGKFGDSILISPFPKSLAFDSIQSGIVNKAGDYKVIQAVVHAIEGKKRKYHLETQ